MESNVIMKRTKTALLSFACACVSLLTACMPDVSGTPSGSSTDGVTEGTSVSIKSSDIVEAIINKDSETIKGMFSERAISLDKELDNEIQKMLDSYSGDFIEYTQHNTGGDSTTGKYEASYAFPVCVFSTSEGYYKLCWSMCSYSKNYSETVGIYNMQLEKWPDSGMNQGGKSMDVVGVITDSNAPAYEKAQEFLKIIYQRDTEDPYDDSNELFKGLLSDSALSGGVTDEEIENFFSETVFFGNLHFGDGWIDYSNGMTVCLETKKEPHNLICFTLDGDKINYISIGEINSDEDIKARISGIEGTGIKVLE